MSLTVLTQKCTECSIIKPIDKFETYTSGNHRKICRACRNKFQQAGRKKNWDKIKHRHKGYTLQRKYGISNNMYQEMLIAQDHVCAICKCNDNMALAVDHCHTTGKVRALLCKSCNLTLGRVKESIEILQNMITYLEE